MSAVRRTVSYIRRGDLFQANMCLRLEADFDGDPLDAFCGAATRLDPPYAAFLRLPEGAVASLSPELFLHRTGTSVLSRPIKGTALRPGDEAAARRQREALERSAKDQAENVMIVDLMRNDLSRVCTPGSVTVPALLRAQVPPRRVAPGLRRARHPAARNRRRGADPRDVPARVGHRRPEGPRPGGHL
jgi:para-aminobenzoate synthetase / 4-amino-4-deoxychorismate lyase